jgi:magnesium-transporting ATPase (P-type)
VPAAVRRCREAGIKIVMVTGDHPHTAVAVAREIGLVQSAAPTLLTGDDLSRMSDTQIQLALDEPEIICARVTADQKLRVVTALQRKRCIVAVTGDGVNDAPALRAADIGIAMGISGTDVAREASDLVLLDDNFASIVDAVEEGRTIFENIRKFLTYILTSNVPELVPYLAFAFARVPLALTVMQILAVDLGTDMVPALALGAEAPYTSFGNALFGTTPIGYKAWLVVLPFAATMLVLEEARKALVRRRDTDAVARPNTGSGRIKESAAT